MFHRLIRCLVPLHELPSDPLQYFSRESGAHACMSRCHNYRKQTWAYESVNPMTCSAFRRAKLVRRSVRGQNGRKYESIDMFLRFAKFALKEALLNKLHVTKQMLQR